MPKTMNSLNTKLHFQHYSCMVGNIVYLALYKGAGVNIGYVSRYKFGSEGEKVGIFIKECDISETFVPFSRFGELVFTTFQEAVNEILKRNSTKEAKL